MVVYLDLTFLLNLLIDGAILAMTAWTRKISVQRWRVAGAAAIGAFYVVMMLFPDLSFLFTFFVKCLFSIAMIYAAFGFGSLQHFLRNLGVFYLINFTAAGGIFALHYFMRTPGDIMNGIFFAKSGGLRFHLQVGIIFTAIVFLAMMLFYRSVITGMKKRETMTNYFAEVQIFVDDFTDQCIGLIDTGNHLYDPLTRTPVMVMEASRWKHILPESWLKRIQQAEVEQIVTAIGTDEFIWQDRLRLVPYRGVNKGTQFMLAIKPDKVVITHHETKVETPKVLIGLDGGKLCADGSYAAIIHPMLMNR